jgi:hypothetical protein
LVAAAQRGFVCLHLFAFDLLEKVLLQVGLGWALELNGLGHQCLGGML